jgi:hypothetical protein
LRLEQLDHLFREITRQHPVGTFIIIGSLTVFAVARGRPIPDAMIASVEVDAWPESDPARAFEIARNFGIGSAFEQRHGYYFDPVSPALPTLPDGWQDRLIPVTLPGGAQVKFVDPNDAAIAKLSRGDSKDLAWVREGVAESFLSVATLVYRFRQTVFLDDPERERVREVLRIEAEKAGISM